MHPGIFRKWLGPSSGSRPSDFQPVVVPCICLPTVARCLCLSCHAYVALGRTYGRSLEFSFGRRTENIHEAVLESVSGLDLSCVAHHLSSLTRLSGSWVQV